MVHLSRTTFCCGGIQIGSSGDYLWQQDGAAVIESK